MLSEQEVSGLRKKIESIFQKYKIIFEEEQTKKGLTYIFRTTETQMQITIDKEWVGYELDVNKDVTGKKIGASADTDNYLTGGDNTSSTLELFKECILVTEALFQGRIFVGIVKSRPILAIPTTDHTYRVTSWRRFTAVAHEVQQDELVGYSELRPVK